MPKQIRIGTGAGYSGDRIVPAVKLAEFGDLDYLVFECLAERTIALAQQRKLSDPSKGYDPLLEKRMRKILGPCAENKTRIITNMGAANPEAAYAKVVELIEEMDLAHQKVGLVTGDDILEYLEAEDFPLSKGREKILANRDKIISANAYLGAEPIIRLLKEKADIIITGRSCDSSLFLAPMMFGFEMKEDEIERIGKGIAVAHLMECGAQVTGGYFADPGYKDVSGLADLGFPIAEVNVNGDAVITKLSDSGGEVSLRTVKEQLLYEVHDPANYITADGIADFTKIRLEEIGKNRVKVSGGGGKTQPNELKVSIGFNNGFIGEAQISYGGEGAEKRAKLAAQILMERLRILNLKFEGLRFDFIGAGSLWPGGSPSHIPKEIRLRVVGRTKTRHDAEGLCNEVEALYTNGPAGGGGVSRKVKENIAIVSSFIPREKVIPQTKTLEVENGSG
ncbi:MAG: DUF1446 domain-containing protein [Methanomassiliicoccales archaeon]|nr:MAG: DUF1446 domain-containing protein [Methanomassiliicoccales archaeon]